MKHHYGRELTGRCHICNIRFIWPTKVTKLRDAYCPLCGGKLRATTHEFKSGKTIRRNPNLRPPDGFQFGLIGED